MTAENPNYLFAKMSTVLSFPIDGIKRSELIRRPNKSINLDSASVGTADSKSKPRTKIEEIDRQVEMKVREIIQELKASHGKFEDPDFGPTETDTYAEKSLYGSGGSPSPAGTNKYPSPDSIRWDRPRYSDNKFQDEEVAEDDEEEGDEFDEMDEFATIGGASDEVWCMDGSLFIDGSSSGDVVQGKLGDCWFLGALSVLGTQQHLLDNCFWHLDSFREYGLYVCVFYKDCALRFVIIDDRIPVFATSGRVVFGQCKDPNELWVPLIEKAYAKLHGSYKALIGGYVHLGLADLTGYVPRLVGLKPGYMGYSDPFDDPGHRDQLWTLLETYQKWGCLMGTSIQSKPGEGGKVEANAGNGLKMGHAYSFLACGVINVSASDGKGSTNVRLVRLRNPWGFGEWTGPWSDNTPEREKYSAEIKRVFATENEAEDVDAIGNDGTFYMTFEDWMKHFTSLFVAINFPEEEYSGQMVKGSWSGDVGGPREMSTWIANPKVKLSLLTDDNSNRRRNVFVGLYINDTRLTLGKEYYTDPLYKVGVGFDLVTLEEFEKRLKKSDDVDLKINNGVMYEVSNEQVNQPPYMFGTTQVDVWLDVSEASEYYIVPSLRNRKLPGVYFLQVYSNGPFEVEGGVSIGFERAPKPCAVGNKQLHLTTAQFYEKTEEVREKLLVEAKRLGITLSDMKRMFRNESIPRTAFKRRLMELGYSLADFPDEDFVVLDENNDGSISSEEFIRFFEKGLDMNDPTKEPPPPDAPPDDLVFQPIDLEGVLTVVVNGAKDLRKASTWFTSDDKPNTSAGAGDGSKAQKPTVQGRKKFHYDVEEAARSHTEIISDIMSAPKTSMKAKTDKKDKNPRADGETAHFPSELSVLTKPGTTDFGPLSVSSRISGGHNILSMDDQVGKEAGLQLHSDAVLQREEIHRTQFLSKFRAKQKLESGVEEGPKAETGLLISKHGMKKITHEKRECTEEILRYLGMSPEAIIRFLRPGESNTSHTSKQQSSSKYDDEAIAVSSMSDTTVAAAAVKKKTTAASRPSTSTENSRGGRYNGLEDDIWDVLVDRVVVISACRSPDAKVLTKILNTRELRPDSLKSLEKPKSNLPTPSKVATPVSATLKGTRSATKGMRKTPGYATAAIAKSQSKSASSHTVSGAYNVLEKLSEEVSYVEVYRRLVAIPLINFNKIDPTLGAEIVGMTKFNFGSTVKSWFEFFDKNRDGNISFDEFALAMKELSANMSNDDMKTLFLRFQTRKMDGLIDWIEFMDFFDNNIQRKTVGETDKVNEEVSLVEVLGDLHDVCRLHRKKPQTHSGAATTSKLSADDDSYSILNEFLTLKEADVRCNAAHLNDVQIPISLSTMGRISRIFSNDLEKLKHFVSVSGVKNLTYIVTAIKENILGALAARCQAHKQFELTSDEELSKLWCAMAPDCETAISYAAFGDYLYEIVCDHLDGTSSNSSEPTGTVTESGKAIDGKSQSDSAPMQDTRRFMGLDIRVLCNIVAEEILYSSWNRLYHKENKSSVSWSLISMVSYSAFKAFIKHSHVGAIEQKLEYLVHLQNCSETGFVNYLLHAYVPSSNDITKKQSTKPDHILLIAYDPLSSCIFRMKVDCDASRIPRGDQLVDIILNRYTHKGPIFNNFLDVYFNRSVDVKGISGRAMVSASNGKLKQNSNAAGIEACHDSAEHRRKCTSCAFHSVLYACRVFNPWETPVEDRAMSDLCGRLRLVNSGQSTILVLSEDAKFVQKLQELLDKASLPFFSIVNEVSLLFEVSQEATRKAGSVQKLVFGNIRQSPPLKNFLVNVVSDIRVVICTYDGDTEESMDWREMLAYLTDNRNPFVTVQLLPKYVEPKRGMIEHVPDDMMERYGVDSENNSAELSFDDDVTEEPGESRVQKGPPDIDGGLHPSWEHVFHIKFKPPKLTNCPVLFSDILQLNIEHSRKYIIIMVRVATDRSLFMTAYDPRTATEYMLFGGPTKWCVPDISNDDMVVLKKEYPHFDPQKCSRLDFFQKQLEDAISAHDNPRAKPMDKFRLGFAITPRLLVSVYNKKGGGGEELLGSCQVSVSSVLSGTGNNTTLLTTLMYEVLGDSGQPSFFKAGSLSIQLGYLKQSEIDALVESKKSSKVRNAESLQASGSRKLSGTLSVAQSRKLSAENVPSLRVEDTKFHDNGTESIVSARMRIEKYQAEKLKLQEELSKLKEEKKMMVAEEEKTKLSQNSRQGRVSADEYETLKAKHDALLKEAEKLRKQAEGRSAEEVRNQTEKRVTESSRAIGEGEVEAVNVTDASNNIKTIIQNIVSVFATRHVKRGGAKDDPEAAMRPLARAIKGYQDDNDCVSAVDVELMFADLLVVVTDSDVEVILDEIGRLSNGNVAVVAFVDFFKSEYAKAYGGSFQRCAEEPVIQKKNDRSNSHSAVKEVTVPVVREERMDEPSVSTSGKEEVANRPLSAGSSSTIDWDTYPLPGDHWERRVDKKRNRVYYVNHKTRSTQWEHPLYQPSRDNRRGHRLNKSQRSSDTSDVQQSGSDSNISKLNKTAPMQPLAPSKGKSSKPSHKTTGRDVRRGA